MNRRHCLRGLAGIAGSLVAGAAGAQSMRKPWPRNKPTPPLLLPSLEGPDWRLADERGHPVLLNFWASWCEPCRAEMPSLERLAAAQRDAGLRVIAANYREGEPAMRRFLSRTPLGLPVVRDADGAAARAFDIHIFPSTVAIDRRGRTRFIVVGEVDWDGPSGAGMLRDLL
ncbi:redoxin domain-containing protein [Ramlibacter sp. MMS24-I3-19]|uniref:TlpA family protein disulfide reductase n=1 Tax=Ramlibacter sp. MMS24-I3-19 TaxID=3416606 RepID=UPI003D03E46A